MAALTAPSSWHHVGSLSPKIALPTWAVHRVTRVSRYILEPNDHRCHCARLLPTRSNLDLSRLAPAEVGENYQRLET